VQFSSVATDENLSDHRVTGGSGESDSLAP
jgi:hypothetical protein